MPHFASNTADASNTIPIRPVDKKKDSEAFGVKHWRARRAAPLSVLAYA